MKIIEEKKLPQSRFFIKVEIPPQQVEEYFQRAFKKIAQDFKIPGFRKGKVPFHVIEKQLGWETIVQEALDLLLPQVYYDIVQIKKLLPVAAPKVVFDNLPQRGKSFEVGFEVDLYPEVQLKDIREVLKKFKFKKNKIKVTKTEVEEVVERLRKGYAKHEEKNTPIEKGDFVEVDFRSFYEDGKPIEGGESKNHPLIVGEGVFVEGFEDNLVGMKKGEKKEFSLTFPKDYYRKELAGKKARFVVEIKEAKKVILPDKDDKFALNFGYKTFPELLKAIEESILKEKENEEDKKLKEELFEFLIKNIEFEVPQSLIEEEIDNIIHQYEHSLEHQGIKLEDYLQKTGKTLDDLRKDFREEAERRVRLGLILNAIAQQQNIQVTEKEVDEEIKKLAQIYNQNEVSLKKRFEESSQIDSLYLQIKTEKTIKFLTDLIKEMQN